MEPGSIKPGGIGTAVKSVEGGSTGTNPKQCVGVAFELRRLPRPNGLPVVATCGDRLYLTIFVQGASPGCAIGWINGCRVRRHR